MSETLHKTSEVNQVAEQVSSLAVLIPAVDIYENEKELILVADMPGVQENNLHIKLDNEVLTLEGISSIPDSDGAELVDEFDNGRYFRQFTLGQSIDKAAIVATLQGGELVLTLPKAAAAQPQKISITSG